MLAPRYSHSGGGERAVVAQPWGDAYGVEGSYKLVVGHVGPKAHHSSFDDD